MLTQVDEPETAELELHEVLHALSDPIRLDIVRSLATRGEQPCGAVPAPVSKSTLSHHFRVLREAGVTRTTPHGTRKLIALRRDDLDGRFPGLLDAVLRP
jgi:DNA-binding transcriptional ArsR family regulator